MRLGWSTEHLVPEGDKLDLGVDVSLLQAPGDGSAPGVPVSSTGEDKPYGDKEVIDEKALIEELQDVFKGIVYLWPAGYFPDVMLVVVDETMSVSCHIVVSMFPASQSLSSFDEASFALRSTRCYTLELCGAYQLQYNKNMVCGSHIQSQHIILPLVK